MKRYFPLLIIISLALSGCSLLGVGTATTQSGTKKVAVGEDLSPYRGNYAAALEVQDEEIRAAIVADLPGFEPSASATDSMVYVKDRAFIERFSKAQRALGQEKKNFDAFTVQVYRGTSRSTADEVKSKAYLYLEDLDLRPVAQWDAPHYKVTVGKFYTKLEAYETYKRLREHLPQTTIVPIRIRK